MKSFAKTDLLADDVSKVLVNLLFDQRKLGEVIWYFIEREAESFGIGRGEIFEGLDADALTEGWNAVSEATISFIPPQRQTAARKALEKMMGAMAEGAAALERVIDSEGTDQMIAEAITAAEQQMTETMQSQLASSVSS